MSCLETKLPIVDRVCSEIACVIISDIMDNLKETDDREIKEFLNLLKGPCGNSETQSLLNKYLGIGEGGLRDFRMLTISNRRYITAVDLKKKIIILLEDYLKWQKSCHEKSANLTNSMSS